MTTDVPARDPAAPEDPALMAIQQSPEFAGLRRTLRRFVFPMTVIFFAWYALYVILSAYARGFMGTKVVGNINVALIFGLLQFLSTFLIAWAYERFASRRLEPVAEDLRRRIQSEEGYVPAARTPADDRIADERTAPGQTGARTQAETGEQS